MDLSVYSRRCLDEFNRLRAKTVPTNGQSDLHSNISGELGRFMIWAQNIGALQNAQEQSSLNHRLRDCEPVLHQIKDILNELDDTLQELVSECTDEDGASLQVGSATGLSNEIEELLDSIRDCTSSLFKISVILRNATPRDRYKRAELVGGDEFNDQFDIAHVQQKFPKIGESPWLAARLGRCTAKRRKYLRYCRDHRAKLSRPLEARHADVETVEKKKRGHDAVEGPSTERHMVSRPESGFAPTSASTLQPDAVLPFDDQAIETQSHTSATTTIVHQSSNSALSVRPLVDISDGHFDFECPYCWSIQHIKNQRTWKKHVFSDLRAYVCTFEHCSDMMFADSYSWVAHEFDNHRQELSCQLCHNTYTSENEFQKHVTSKHSMKASSTQLTALTRAALHQKEEVGAGECPFCDEWENALRSVNEHIPEDQPVLVPRRQYRRHVAHHMENLALFAITPHMAESDEEALCGSNEAALHDLDDPSKHKGERHFATLFDEEEAEETPLHFAAANGLLEDVKLLLDGGEDPNSLNAAGTTAVELAEYEGHHEIASYLYQRGAQKHNVQRRVGRSRGACLRCKLTRDLCVGGDPCIRCTKAPNRSWQIPCTSVDIKDMGDFVNSSLLDAPSGYNPKQYESFTTPEYPPTSIKLHYGRGKSFVIMVQKSPLSDDDSLRVSWDECTHEGLQEFSVLRTETWITKPGDPLRPKIAEYIKSYVDSEMGHSFRGENDQERPRRRLLSESLCSNDILSLVLRYYKNTNETILGKSLHLYVAFRLVGQPTLMERDSIGENTEGRVTIPESRYYRETLAPGRIDKAIKYELTALWRSYHYEVLEELSSLFTSVYSGDRLRNWTAIFTVTVTLLMVWEKMQYEFRRKDATKGEELCAEMERIAVPVLTGLVQAISQKLPSFIEWGFEKHQHLLGSNEATNFLMTDIRRYVMLNEKYLRSRADAEYDPNNPSCFNMKFVSRILLRNSSPPISAEGKA